VWALTVPSKAAQSVALSALRTAEELAQTAQLSELQSAVVVLALLTVAKWMAVQWVSPTERGSVLRLPRQPKQYKKKLLLYCNFGANDSSLIK